MENYIIANCTDTGRTRRVNEDSMVTFDSPNGRVVAVCDGMGGQNAGDVASQLAVAVIQDILSDNTFATPEEAITSSVIAANQAILRKASMNEDMQGMGATCVMLIVKDGKVYYGSIGDSRIYYIANGMIRQITKDQSYVQTLVDAGQITLAEAEHHQDKNQITNALGVEGMTPPVIGQMPIIPEPNSTFLLCSDGLSGMINNNTILNTVSRYDLSLNERARMLVEQANEAGGLDNITVQLVEFPAEDMAMSPMGSPSVSSAIAQPKKKSHAVLYSLIAVLLVIAVAGGAYWYFHEDEKPQPKTSVTTKVKPQKNVKKVNKDTAIEKVVVEEVLDNKTSSKSTAKKVKDKTINDGVQKIKGNQNGKKLPPTPKAIIPNPDPAIDMIKKDLSGDKK
mgnify:FL=1